MDFPAMQCVIEWKRRLRAAYGDRDMRGKKGDNETETYTGHRREGGWGGVGEEGDEEEGARWKLEVACHIQHEHARKEVK